MYHVVRCHYCCGYHSRLEYYPFDDHDHGLDHVIDVLLNLDDRARNDDHYDVRLNVNEFYLNIIKLIDYHSNKKMLIHTTFMFTTSTSATIYNIKN